MRLAFLWFVVGLLAFLLKAYFRVEGGYYKVMDALQKAGVPAYKFFVNPIEARGVPSFPVFALIVAAVAFVVLSLALPVAPQARDLEVIVTGLQGERVSGARVTLFFGGKELASTATVLGSAKFAGVPLQVLSIKIEKEGYAAYSNKIPAGLRAFNAVIELSEEEKARREALAPPVN
ncbi:MAG: hypothetical protein ACP5IG_04100 [Candidatus Micrarchaeia archaeon]